MKYWQWILIIFFTLCLIGVRVLEDNIFYDPFLDFFRSTKKVFPSFQWSEIIISHIFRFFLNSFFSLMIIYFFCLNKKWTILSGMVILLVFFLFFPIYLYNLYSKFEFGQLFAFYIRRIVIQPMTLLILLPILYYKKYSN